MVVFMYEYVNCLSEYMIEIVCKFDVMYDELVDVFARYVSAAFFFVNVLVMVLDFCLVSFEMVVEDEYMEGNDDVFLVNVVLSGLDMKKSFLVIVIREYVFFVVCLEFLYVGCEIVMFYVDSEF